MRSYFVYFLLCVCSLSACNNDDKKIVKEAVVEKKMPDEDAIKKAVDDAYKVLCFKRGEKFNYDNMRTAFVPEAHFLNFRTDTLETITLEGLIKGFKDLVESNAITSFYEEELYGKTEQFGRIAQRISTYKTYINTMDSVAERGVNSFQLVKTPQGWKVSSIIWDIEKPAFPIPPYYLTADSIR